MEKCCGLANGPNSPESKIYVPHLHAQGYRNGLAVRNQSGFRRAMIQCDNWRQMTKRVLLNRSDPAAGQQRLEFLRSQHPRFVYDSFSLDRGKGSLRVRFRFRIEPEIEFAPEVVFDLPQGHRMQWPPDAVLNNLVFHLGLIEMLSYWKATCSPEIVVRAGALDAQQIAWWMDLLRRGMGEYFYVNQIDFRPPDFVRIVASEVGQASLPVAGTGREACTHFPAGHDLVLTSGGKDSAVMLELLRAQGCAFDCLMVNPTEAARALVRQAGNFSPIVVRHTIDRRLLELNAAGYLNGHTPFSALLAFLGILAAALGGYRRVLVANERSAEEAGAVYLGEPINHQFSKTFQFETAFRQYSQKYLAPGVEYFSLLRPLYELQIARLFSSYPQYFPLFRSCNRSMATNSWCGRCPKCLFVYTVLYPFLDWEQMLGIFGADLFAWDGAAEVLQALLGLDQNKPFECVGTKEETLAAIVLCIEKMNQQGIPLPPALLAIEQASNLRNLRTDLAQRILTSWTDRHHHPPDLAEVLRIKVRSGWPS